MIAGIIVAAAILDGPPADFNAKVVAFARDHEGKQVGDGVCSTLIQEAMRHAGARVLERPAPDGAYLWGAAVDSIADVRPGDVVQFEDVVFQSRRRVVGDGGRPALLLTKTSFPHHSAIVAAVGPRGATITILHQNAIGPDGEPVMTVEEATLVMAERRKGGTIKFYRPVAP